MAYIEIVKEYPTMVIKERLDGTNILWSIMHPSNGFNSRYAVGIWFPNQMTNEEWEIIKKFNPNIDTKKPGITYTNNIANVYKKAASISEKYIVLDLFIWRAGIYLALLLLWLFYILNNNKKLIWILIPLLGNTATWIVFLAYQTFRYMWYFQVIVFFILLTTFVFGKKVKDGDEIGYEKNEKNR